MLSRSLITVLIFVSICVAAMLSPLAPSPIELKWYSIVPPLLAISLAFATRKLFLSLFIAITVGAVLLNLHQPFLSMLFSTASDLTGYVVSAATSSWNLLVLAFVIVMLTMLSVIIFAGGFSAIVVHIAKLSRTRQSSTFYTALLGLVVFIDDYANTMIVGSSMRPITDKFNVSREKLAFIVDSSSAPVAGLAVISTWIGYEVGLFGEVANSLNLQKDGYSMFFDAFVYRFYCLLMLAFLFINIWQQKDFGPMWHAEHAAQREGMPQSTISDHAEHNFRIISQSEHGVLSSKTAIFPITILFLSIVTGLWIDGGGLSRMQDSIFTILSLSEWRLVISSTQNNALVLLISAVIGLASAVFCAHHYAKLSPATLLPAVKNGLQNSKLPVFLLLLAWALKSVCDDLNTGEFLVALLSYKITPLLFPAIVFFIAAITSLGTGTSWGTMAILIPTVIPVAYALDDYQYGLITIVSLAAVLDGSIFGDHCSPISDTTIMSSISSGCDHLRHVATQIPYAVTVALAALLLCYIPVMMFNLPIVMCLLLSLMFFFLTLHYLGKSFSK